MKKHFSTGRMIFILAFLMTITMSSVAKADAMKPISLSKLNVIAKPTLDFTEVIDYKGDKIVVGNRKGKYVDGNETYGLINLNGKKLLDYKYREIRLLDNGYILVHAKNSNVYLYNQNMKFLKKFKSVQDISDDSGNAFVIMKNNNNYLYMIINGTCKKIDSVDNLNNNLNSSNIYISDNNSFIKDTGKGYVYAKKTTGTEYCVTYSGIKNAANSSAKMIIPGFYIDYKSKTIVNDAGKVIISKYQRIDFDFGQNPDYLTYTVDGKNVAVSKDGSVLAETTDKIRVYNTFYAIYKDKGTTQEITLYTFNHTMIGRIESAPETFSNCEIDSGYICLYHPYTGNVYIFDVSSKEKKQFTISMSAPHAMNLNYFNDIKAFEVQSAYYDSGMADMKPFRYLDFEGNDIFKNNFNITVDKYLGDGYYVFNQNGKKGIGLLPSFPKKSINRIVKKIVVPADIPSKTKIKKIWKKKRSEKTLKLSVKKIKNVSGYEVKVYGSKKNAKKNIKALVTKKTKKTIINIKSKKIAKKKALYVKVRVYRKDIKEKVYSSWSVIRKVKIVK